MSSGVYLACQYGEGGNVDSEGLQAFLSDREQEIVNYYNEDCQLWDDNSDDAEEDEGTTIDGGEENEAADNVEEESDAAEEDQDESPEPGSTQETVHEILEKCNDSEKCSQMMEAINELFEDLVD